MSSLEIVVLRDSVVLLRNRLDFKTLWSCLSYAVSQLYFYFSSDIHHFSFIYLHHCIHEAFTVLSSRKFSVMSLSSPIHSGVLSYRDQTRHSWPSLWAYSLFLQDGVLMCQHYGTMGFSFFTASHRESLPFLLLIRQVHQLALFGLLFSWLFLVSISLQEAHHLIITPRCHLPKDGRQVCSVSHPTGIPRWLVILNTRKESLSLLSDYEWLWVLIRPSCFWCRSDFPRNNLAKELCTWQLAVLGWYLVVSLSHCVIESLWGFSLDSGHTLHLGK